VSRWPVLYAVFDAPKIPAFIRLTHAALIWFFSLIAFFWISGFLKDYSRTLSLIRDGLVFVINVLSFILWL
jgi:hypothetical protein